VSVKQPRVPEYRDGESMSVYIRNLIRFLKDFSMNVWTAYRQTQRELERVCKDTHPVTSVNGKTGAVTLAAGDVEARPNTWMPDRLVGNVSEVLLREEPMYPGILIFGTDNEGNKRLQGTIRLSMHTDHDGYREIELVDYNETKCCRILTEAYGTAVNAGKLGGKGPSEFAEARRAVPNGGTAGQVLCKKSVTDYDTEWKDPAGGGVKTIQLWKNASPASAFTPQTVSIESMRPYEWFIFVFKEDGSKSDTATNHPLLLCKKGFLYKAFNMHNYRQVRNFIVNDTSVTFDKGMEAEGGSYLVDKNTHMIPFEIYGLEGMG